MKVDATTVSKLKADREVMMVCPVCGNTHVHPVQAYCNPAGNYKGVVAINCNGVHLIKGVPPSGRGVFLRLGFHCAGGHEFSYQFQLRKDNTFLSTRTRKPRCVAHPIWQG